MRLLTEFSVIITPRFPAIDRILQVEIFVEMIKKAGVGWQLFKINAGREILKLSTAKTIYLWITVWGIMHNKTSSWGQFWPSVALNVEVRQDRPVVVVFLPKESFSCVEDPTSKLGLDADIRTLESVFPWKPERSLRAAAASGLSGSVFTCENETHFSLADMQTLGPSEFNALFFAHCILQKVGQFKTGQK